MNNCKKKIVAGLTNHFFAMVTWKEDWVCHYL